MAAAQSTRRTAAARRRNGARDYFGGGVFEALLVGVVILPAPEVADVTLIAQFACPGLLSLRGGRHQSAAAKRSVQVFVPSKVGIGIDPALNQPLTGFPYMSTP
jgi:hypothetical protein